MSSGSRVQADTEDNATLTSRSTSSALHIEEGRTPLSAVADTHGVFAPKPRSDGQPHDPGNPTHRVTLDEVTQTTLHPLTIVWPLKIKDCHKGPLPANNSSAFWTQVKNRFGDVENVPWASFLSWLLHHQERITAKAPRSVEYFRLVHGTQFGKMVSLPSRTTCSTTTNILLRQSNGRMTVVLFETHWT